MFALILSFLLLITQAFLARHFISQQYEITTEINKNWLESVAIAATELVTAEQLEQYLQLYDSLTNIGENIEDTEEYQKFRQILTDFAEEHKIMFAYFVKRVDEDNFQYIIDNDTAEPVSPADVEELFRNLRIAFETGTPTADRYGDYEEGWEGIISAFAPFYDTEGNLVFVAGVDIEDVAIITMKRNISFLSIAQIVIIFITLICGITIITLFRKKVIKSEESSIAKSNFFATISHEIRTPLNSIMGLTEIELNNNKLPKQTTDNLKQIRASGNKLLRIINEIVDLSKIDTGKFILSQEKYDSGSFINDIITAGLVKYSSNNNVELKCSVSPNIPSLMFGDTLHIKKVIDKILANAFKYTIKGNVTIDFDFEQTDNKDEGILIISVEDTGIGIKENDTKRLTGIYSQISANANRTFEGLGIGLTISMKLMKLMGGDIIVESVFGKGSKFTIKVPQKIMSDKELGNLANDLANFSYKNLDNEKSVLDKFYMPYGKILVVDDVQTNLDVAKGYMSIYGLHVDCALSGEKAIEKIKSQEIIYDCIFMDHMMPQMDGIETLQKIRTIGTDYAKTIPIIAFTANASAGTEEMFLKNGFDDFMSKPINSEKLDKVLNKFIKEKQSKETLQDAEEKRILILESKEKTNRVFVDILDNTEIDGVNLMGTFNKFSGDFDAYYSAIQSFIKYSPEAIKKIKEMTPQNVSEYAVVVHGLKGSCYGIGAKDCGDSAKELELAAKSGNFEEISGKNTDFIAKLERIITALQKLTDEIGELKSKSDDRKTEEKPSKDLLDDLLIAAENYDIDQINAVMNNLNAFKYKEQNDLIKELNEAAQEFRYDDIIAKLQASQD